MGARPNPHYQYKQALNLDQNRVEHLVATRPNPLYNTACLNLDQIRVEHLVASRPNPLYNTARSKSRTDQERAPSGGKDPTLTINTASSKSRPEQSRAPSGGKTQPSL